MTVVFRCYSCETINDIPERYKYRLCKKCGKIVTYSPGEAIVCKESDLECSEFLKEGNLSAKLAQKFFTKADTDYEMISEIIQKKETYEKELPDIPTNSVSDTIIFLLQINQTETLDELIKKCEMLNLSLNKIDKIFLQMKKEGIVYNPKGWIIRLT